MASYSISDLMKLINQQVVSQEKLTDSLSKAQALIQVALGNDFLDYENFIIHDYLWALSDLIEQARFLNEHSLDGLLKNDPPSGLV